MNTEQKLKKLFDYQRFEKNSKLENLIRETENRYYTELSDDDLSFVNAAGETDTGAGFTGGTNIWGEGQQGEILFPQDKN